MVYPELPAFLFGQHIRTPYLTGKNKVCKTWASLSVAPKIGLPTVGLFPDIIRNAESFCEAPMRFLRWTALRLRVQALGKCQGSPFGLI